jgi:hypothetical protein
MRNQFLSHQALQVTLLCRGPELIVLQLRYEYTNNLTALGKETEMVTTCIYRGLAKGRVDHLYLFCLPFGYVGVFLLLHFGTDMSVSMVCATALLIGDAPGAMLAGIIAGCLTWVAKSEGHPGSTVRNFAGAHSAVAPKDHFDRASNKPLDGH